MSAILLVEDREDDILMARHVIKKLAKDCAIVVARDGEEALEIIGRHGPGHFQVILLDIQLPKIDGLEVLRSIRSDGRMSGQPVAMLTTSSSETDMARARALSADMYLVKPLGIKEFTAQMKTVLDRFC